MLSEFENLPGMNNAFYSVFFTDIDYMQSDVDIIGEIRKSYFDNGQRIKNKIYCNSGDDKLKFSYDLQKGSNLKWRKMRNDILEETSIDIEDGYIIETYSIEDRKVIKRTFFDKEHNWIKTFYFNNHNRKSPFLILEHIVYDDNDTIRKTIFDNDGKKFEEILSPFPISTNHDIENTLNSMAGIPEVYCIISSGKFYYCNDESYNKRAQALRSIVCDYNSQDEESDLNEINLDENDIIEEAISTDDIIEETVNSPKQTQDIIEENHTNIQYVDACIVGNCPMYPLPKKIINVSDEEKYCYFGAISENNRSGYGRTIMDNGMTAYEGYYKDDMRNGYGAYYYKNGKLCYVGDWKDNKKNGVGIAFSIKDESICVGNWENDKLCGIASQFDKNGNLIYSGNAKNGRKNGAGITYLQDTGNIFIGKWQDGVFMNYGTEISADGNLIYSGGYKNNMRNGYGALYNLNGSIKYIGDWKDNKYNGAGVLQLNDGRVIDGNFEDGLVCDTATETNAKGYKLYEGEWKNNLYNGTGRKYFKNGGYCEGEFKDGIATGIMSGYNSNGNIVYVGEYKDDLPNGSGICYKNGKKEYEGNFTDGVKNGNGKLFDDEKCYYTGQMLDNLQDGYGEYYCDGVITYKGIWSKGMYNGCGVLYENGEPKYVGEFCYDKMNGRINEIENGKIIKECIYDDNKCTYMKEYSSDDMTLIYDGNIKNDQKNGMGCSFVSYGEKLFEGIFKNNEPSKSMRVSLKELSDLPYCPQLENTDYDKYRKGVDFAVELNINGGVYSGHLYMGKPNDKGTILYSDHRYTGNFSEGVPCGEGIIYTKSGDEIKGLFTKIKEHNTQEKIFDNGIVYYYTT